MKSNYNRKPAHKIKTGHITRTEIGNILQFLYRQHAQSD